MASLFLRKSIGSGAVAGRSSLRIMFPSSQRICGVAAIGGLRSLHNSGKHLVERVDGFEGR